MIGTEFVGSGFTTTRRCSFPNDFVLKQIFPKHFIQHTAHVTLNPPIAMHIDTSLRVHQIAHQNQPFIDHSDEGVGAAAPGVAIGDLFEEVGLFVKGLAADFDVHGEVRADIEGRVDIDEFEAAGVFDLTAERAGFERRENQLVVAPDEFVGPAFDLASAHAEAEFVLVGLLLTRLIDMFQGLKREDGGANLAGFSVPDEFDLAGFNSFTRSTFIKL